MKIKDMPQRLTNRELALAAHVPVELVKTVTQAPLMSYLMDEKSFYRGSRTFGVDESENILAALGLTKGGIPLPLAAEWLISIREQGIFAPVHIARIECRRNGRTFAFLNEHANDAAEAAGPVLFQVTIDFDGYRAAFREALAARQPAAERDAA